VSTATLRNVGIILLLAVAVFLLPGGGQAADIVIALLGVLFSVAIWLFLMRMYREHRMTLFGWPDRIRGIFYACGAGLLFAGASAGRWWESGLGTLAWMVLVGAIIYGFVMVWRNHREYA
jgi:hypothetical protein